MSLDIELIPGGIWLKNFHGAIDDASLISRIQYGSAAEADSAFTELFNRYHSRLTGYLIVKGLSTEEAYDCASETWLRVYRLVERYQDRGIGIFAWLRAITDKVAQELFRKTNRQYLCVPIEETDVEIRLPDPNANTADRVFTALDRQETQEAIRSALQQAPEDYGIIIEFSFLAEFTTEEIMDLTGWSKSKVYTTKHRALSWLRENLKNKEAVLAPDT